MDDATYNHLVKHRITRETPKPKFDSKYKDRILDLTGQLMENKITGSLKDAFDAYASECIFYLETPIIIPTEQRLAYDTILQPKKIHFTVKK
jgi:hypothetical protein